MEASGSKRRFANDRFELFAIFFSASDRNRLLGFSSKICIDPFLCLDRNCSFFHRVEPLGLVWLFVSGLSLWIATRFPLRSLSRSIAFAIFLFFAIALSDHMLPGFNNLLVFHNVEFSSDSIPFSMYLNFDKTAVGIFIYLIFLKDTNQTLFDRKQLAFAFKILGLLTVVMLPLALATHYVRIDPKIPSGAVLWSLNNLFFVSFSEEALYRGFIQGGMSKLLARASYGRWVPLIVSSLTFGLDHYQGGLPYISLATIAGLFYGYTYQRTRNLEAAMLVHFGLNLLHFLFFSYPSLKAGLT